MRVLHVIDHLGLGGAQSALLDLLEARSPAVQASVLVLRDRDLAGIPERLAAAQVPLLRAGLSAGAPAGLGHLWRAISAAEIVHTHLEVSCHLAGSMVLARGRRRPLLVIQTDNDPHHYTAPHRLMARALGPHADAHVVLGPSIAEALRQLVGRQLPRIAVIPLGIRPDRFSREHADGDEVQRLRAGAALVIGSVGRLAPQKDLGTLLEALRLLEKRHPGLRMLIVGDGPLRPSLELRAKELGLDGLVQFIGPRRDLATIYAALDVLVLPSLYEGQGLVLAEAAAAGVPVVATAVSGVVDVVEDGHDGLLVPPRDPAALARALQRVLADPALRAALAAQARRKLECRFTVEHAARSTEHLYRDLLASRPC